MQLDHVTIRTRDIEATHDLYVNVFGTDHAAEALDHVGFRLAGYAFRAKLDRLGIPYSTMDLDDIEERRLFFHAPGRLHKWSAVATSCLASFVSLFKADTTPLIQFSFQERTIMPPITFPAVVDRKKPIRSAFLAAAFAIAATFSGPSLALAEDQNWVGTWMASPQPIWGSDFPFTTKIPVSVKDQTFRQIAKISLGGSRVRLVFSNAYGDQPMRIGGASVGLAGENGAIESGTIRKVTFGGKDGIVVPPGAPAVSDPLDMTVKPRADLAVSIYWPDETPLTTFHWDGRQTAWFGDGNLTRAEGFPVTATTDARVFLSEVLVDTPNEGAVVVIGDSITDGNGAAVDADTRWPDFLAERLAPQRIAVLNAGISGGRLLQDKMGVNVSARMERDVFAQPNVKAAIVLIGINDISWPGTDLAPDQMRPTAKEIIAGYQQLIALAEVNNVWLIGATLPPFEGALSGTSLDNYYHADKDALRQEINLWIRESGAFDAIADFDAVLRDPDNPSRINPAFDSGDHLHPGDEGNRAMADAIDLDALLGADPSSPQ